MRIVFAGTPDPAVVALQHLIDSGHDVVGVITRPDARKGRGRTIHPSPVAALAEKHAPIAGGGARRETCHSHGQAHLLETWDRRRR